MELFKRILSYNKGGSWKFGLIMVLELIKVILEVKTDYLFSMWGMDSKLQTEWEPMFEHASKVISFVVAQLVLNIIDEFFKGQIRMTMSNQLHEDLMESIMNAPVTTFFDMVPTSKIQGKLHDDVHNIDHVLWFFGWMVHNVFRLFTTIIMLANMSPSILLVLAFVAF